MKKAVSYGLQITGLIGAIVGLEYLCFQNPSLLLQPAGASSAQGKAQQILAFEGEKRLRNIRQLTDGGENAEAYWSPDGKQIILQATRDGLQADQIFLMDADGSNVKMLSNGKGRTTCSYFFRSGLRAVYASTHLGGDAPPPRPDYSRGYVWPVYDTYDIFTIRTDGSELKPITDSPGYDAEATVDWKTDRIVFTSMRDGDLDIYTMERDGTDVKRLTDALGYDGGAFFSPDGKKICYRANHPTAEADVRDYKDLLAKNLVRPNKMELWIMDADGSNKKQITSNGAANFCPFFSPDGTKLIFASNVHDPNPRSRNFDLYMVNVDGTGLERVTFDPAFDAFPMFSPDGKKLLWASNRNGKKEGDTNVFVADWVW
ncbi:MAG: TolB family protein [Armatimonadota bacterium]